MLDVYAASGLFPAPATYTRCPDERTRHTSAKGFPVTGEDEHRSGERIAKVIARAGLASRREVEAWIAAGRVAINGKVIDSPAVNVSPADRVSVDGAPLPARERTRLFLFHKARGLVTTHADPEGRPTIFGGLPKNLPRLISIGRLDLNTEGLLLLTNDGGLARVLELPETGWLRRYRVRAHGRVTQAQLDTLRDGVTIDGIRYGPIEAAVERDQGSNVWIIFAIREGKNREVKNVLGHLGLEVARLIRVSFGPFQLGQLPPGAIEEVKTRHLREQLGERIAALAGCDFSAPMSDSSTRPAAPANLPARERGAAKGISTNRTAKPQRGAGQRAPIPKGESLPATGSGGGRPKADRVGARPAAKKSSPGHKGPRRPNKDAERPRRRGKNEEPARPAAKPHKLRRRYHGKRDR